MAAGDKIYVCRYAKHPTDAIAGVAQATLSPAAVSRFDPGAAGSTGRSDTVVTDNSLFATLMAIDSVFCLRSAVHGIATLAEAVMARIAPATKWRQDPGAAGTPGAADALVTDYEVAVEVYGTKYAELLALLGATAADLTLGIEGVAGANQTIVLSSVYFSEPIGEITLAEKDSGGALEAAGIRGHVHFGAAQVFADVITATPTRFTGLLAKIGATAANLVLGTQGAAGALEKITVKNVYFVEPVGALEIARKDVGGRLPSSFGARGIALWGAADTFATMIAPAADA
ncbi:MAG TPA: hypothetical protein VFH61_18915 [Thermoleophilia bacterium]|nr:hypothetical protein [Thermoleophilia bacterium]